MAVLRLRESLILVTLREHTVAGDLLAVPLPALASLRVLELVLCACIGVVGVIRAVEVAVLYELSLPPRHGAGSLI